MERGRTHLEDYIKSNGLILPDDRDKFKIGGIAEDHCVFCGEAHNHNRVFIYNLSGKMTKESTEVFCCDTCNDEIELTLAEIDTPIKRYNESNKTQRTRNFMEFEFDQSVNKFFRHLIPSKDLYAKDNPNKCYVCDSRLEDAMECLQVPVKFGPLMNGGNVHICNSCAVDLRDISDSYRQRLDSGAIFKSSCIKCKKSYYITAGENHSRIANDSKVSFRMEYMCPECAYEVNDKLTPKSWLFLMENRSPRSGPMVRKIPRVCYTCKGSFTIDLTIHHPHLEAAHLLEDDKVICHNCSKQGIKKFLMDDFTYQFSDVIWIKLSSLDDSDGMYKFDLYRMPRGGKVFLEKEPFVKSSIAAENVLEAIAIIFDEVNMMMNGKQTEIWE